MRLEFSYSSSNLPADLSAAVGRTSQTNNIIMGDSQSEDKWRELDAQVCEEAVPSFRCTQTVC